jgi:hypothetical protein
VKIEEKTLTPAEASTLLASTGPNRKLIRSRVANLARAIERGEWTPDGNPIRVSDKGVLLDGQHRLSAIVESDTPVPVILLTGLSADSQLVMDSGKARSFHDYLTIRGIGDAHQMAATTTLLWNYEHGIFTWRGTDWFSRPTPTHQQLWELFQKREDDIRLGSLQGKAVNRVVRISRSVVSVAWIVLGAVECDKCGPVPPDLDDFYDQLAMRKVAEFDSITLLIKLMNAKDRAPGISGPSVYSQKVQMALVLKAWNYYREGRPIQTLRFSLGGKAGVNRENFPVPH